jgi:predicted transglutaminase-like protease
MQVKGRKIRIKRHKIYKTLEAQDTVCYDFDTEQLLTVKYLKCSSIQVLGLKTTQNAYC